MTDEMREPTFLVLSALAAGPSHGYGVMREVAAISEGRVELRTSTLYSVLERLLGDGLIEESSTEVVDGRFRRYYALSEPGADRLRVEALRLRRNANEATRRLRLRPAIA